MVLNPQPCLNHYLVFTKKEVLELIDKNKMNPTSSVGLKFPSKSASDARPCGRPCLITWDAGEAGSYALTHSFE